MRCAGKKVGKCYPGRLTVVRQPLTKIGHCSLMLAMFVRFADDICLRRKKTGIVGKAVMDGGGTSLVTGVDLGRP